MIKLKFYHNQNLKNQNWNKLIITMSDKIECECGSKVSKSGIKKHLQTKKHIDILEEKIYRSKVIKLTTLFEWIFKFASDNVISKWEMTAEQVKNSFEEELGDQYVIPKDIIKVRYDENYQIYDNAKGGSDFVHHQMKIIKKSPSVFFLKETITIASCHPTTHLYWDGEKIVIGFGNYY